MDSNLKNQFENVKDYKNDIDNVLKYINNKNLILTNIYNDYLTEHINKSNYKNSLDTFNFQTKLINLEYQSYTKIYKIFINRMYGDYYKLYKKLVYFIESNINELTNFNLIKIVLSNNYPKYKDLEIYNEYSFETIDNIFTEILSIISELGSYCIKENHLIRELENKKNHGININHFLNEKKYSIIILEQRINFYYELLNGYIQFQNKYSKRLLFKLKLIYTQISHDIDLETSISKHKNIKENDENDEIKKVTLSENLNSFILTNSDNESDILEHIMSIENNDFQKTEINETMGIMSNHIINEESFLSKINSTEDYQQLNEINNEQNKYYDLYLKFKNHIQSNISLFINNFKLKILKCNKIN